MAHGSGWVEKWKSGLLTPNLECAGAPMKEVMNALFTSEALNPALSYSHELLLVTSMMRCYKQKKLGSLLEKG